MDSIAFIIAHYLPGFLLLLLLVGSIISFVVGLTFLLIPTQAIALNNWLNSRYSLRSSMKPLESSHLFEPTIYRHHQATGLFIVFGASYVLYQLGFNYHHSTVIAILDKQPAYQFLATWLLDALLWFSVPAMLLILLFGATLATRPSRLKGLEEQSNRWISTRRWLLPLEVHHSKLDQFVQNHPRAFGLIVAVLSAYSLSILLMFYLS